MRLVLALTVQPGRERMRFFSYTSETTQVPRVGDKVAVARHANTSPDSSPITATVTTVTWQDPRCQSAVVHLRAEESAITISTLIDGANWIDEDPD